MKGNKSITLSVVVIIGVVIMGLSIGKYLSVSTQRMLQNLEEVENSIGLENWEEANAKMAYLMKEWDNTSSKWSAFTNHHEIDNITVSFKTTFEYIKAKDRTESLASMSTLKHFIYHIPLMEKLSLENIF